MKFQALPVALATVLASCSHALTLSTDGANVNPLTKVLQMLTDLEAKIIKNGEAEKATYQKFSDWCRTGAKDKQFDIQTSKSSIQDLTATIEKANSDIASNGAKVESLANSLASNEADLKAATEIRDKENKDFVSAEKELVDSIDTLARAVNMLQRKLRGSALLEAKVDRKDVANLIRTLSEVVDAAALSVHDRQQLLALTQGGDSEEASDLADELEMGLGAPAAQAYSSHSSSIVDVLEDLREKAEAQLAELRKEEGNARHNFDLTKQSLVDQMKVDAKEKAGAQSLKETAAQTKAEAEGDLAVTKKDLAQAEEVLKDISLNCMSAATDHEASEKGRAEELQALRAAMQALKDSASGAQTAYSFLQIDLDQDKQMKATSLHLRTGADLANFEVVNLVRKLAREQHSAALAQLAGRLADAMRGGAAQGQDPFVKVKGLIGDMIARLEKQAGEEATHKAYCDKEMGETQQKADELQYDIEKMTGKLDKASAESKNLKSEVAALTRELAEIAQSQAALDAVRKEEHAVFLQTKSDLELGLSGVRMALKVLREYYATKSSAIQVDALPAELSLLQQPQSPGVHSKSDGAAGGIIGMLEVIESDIGKSMANNQMEEESSAIEYEKVSMQNRLAKVSKEQDVTYKNKEAAALDKAITELASDLSSTRTESDAVAQYNSNIRAACVAKPEGYNDRKGRREAEIAGLKEALKVLDGEALLQRHGAFLQRSGHKGAISAPVQKHF